MYRAPDPVFGQNRIFIPDFVNLSGKLGECTSYILCELGVRRTLPVTLPPLSDLQYLQIYIIDIYIQCT